MFIFLMCHVLKMVYSYFVSLIYIKLDVIEIIEREKERIANDPELRHLVGREGSKYSVLTKKVAYLLLFKERK